MKLIILVLLSTLLFSANTSFSKSKKQLRTIYQGHQTTIYCDCKYNYKDKKNMIDRKSCGYEPRNKRTKKGKVNQRTRRIEWEHLIPSENFGRQFSCWREGDPKCINSKGKRYKGRRCCTKVNKKYKLMQADMHNLFPAVGELNADRSNFKFDFDIAHPDKYGACEFDVNFKQRRVKVREEIRGIIARDYLYFYQKYNMKISKQEMKKFKAWNKSYPPNDWEIKRNKLISIKQGNSNKFIK